MEYIELPKPNFDNKLDLMDALLNRRTRRKWKDESIDIQEVSNILFCAVGETKKATKRSKNRRVIPSARNSQVISVYVALDSGTYLYHEPSHSLQQITEIDVRENLATQSIINNIPMGLIYVADFRKLTMYASKDMERMLVISGTETGSIYQNVNLYASAKNLATVVLGLVDRDLLHKTMNLHENQQVMFTQIIGKSME